MKSYPLVKSRWSNEHITAGVFIVLLLYQIPVWMNKPTVIPGFLFALVIGLAIDVIWNMIRYKRITCAVSSAVTVGIIQTLYPDIPIWGTLLGVAIALVLGKHLWGGTGKNGLNPAMVGVIILYLLFPTELRVFTMETALVPALVLSIPFILIRPFASLGFIFGMTLSLGFQDMLSLSNFISLGVIFWGTMVITDPVTVTYRPLFGTIGGLAVGFSSIFYYDTFYPGGLVLGILLLNVISFLVEKYIPLAQNKNIRGVKLNKLVDEFDGETVLGDNHKVEIAKTNVALTPKAILERIKGCEVVGLGGAAFPTSRKIKTVMDSGAEKKYFIINAVECDPGLIHDRWLLRQHTEEIKKGIQLMTECIDFEQVILAVKGSFDQFKLDGVMIRSVADAYPMGAERILIRNVLGIDLSYDLIPAHEGILVLNVQTIFSIYESVYFNKKADSKYITLANLKKNEAKPIRVTLGSHIINLAKSIYPNEGPIFVGGGAMQARRVREDDVIEETTNFIGISEVPYYKESPFCSKCGICVKNCPSKLEVYKIANLVEQGQAEQTTALNPDRCISCGICSSYCLAGRNLSQKVRVAKSTINDLHKMET